MIRSMTGYGRFQQTTNGLDITVEVKSVNHRYYEYSSRVPRAYGFLDEFLKSYIQKTISRGKVDVYVWIEAIDASVGAVNLNYTLAEGYLQALTELGEKYGIRNDISVSQLARFPDVLTVRRMEEDEETIWEAVRQVADAALKRFVLMREREGEALREDILNRAATILESVKLVEERSPITVKEHMDKVEARMLQLLNGVDIDEQRILTEAALYADKTAVAEETVRLRSHLNQLETILSGDGPVGRKLDFLVQEINREANTIGSKSQDVTLARVVVDIKAEIEKIREQIQNIE
ncbi:MAG: YicC family protein [Oscillospiraceae bacterium]|nr:YicC family protein [Oscillospiraceae bacterium]MDD3832306.1 YicC family protein [Oscillospiraceae bacterium]MDD4546087.1 YicC family protein [Oscillospiraceae bacterium]